MFRNPKNASVGRFFALSGHFFGFSACKRYNTVVK